MHAQVAAVAELAQDRVRHRADPRLDHRAIADIVRGVAGDGCVDFADRGGRHLDQRARGGDRMVDPRCVQPSAVREGHLRVDLRDDDAGAIDRRQDMVRDEAQAVIAVIVGPC